MRWVLAFLLVCAAVAAAAETRSSYGSATSQGRRRYQEDRLAAIPKLGGGQGAVFMVFDGHIGSRASQFLVDNFEKMMLTQLELAKGDYESALSRTLKLLNAQFLDVARKQSLPDGSTACVVMANKEEKEMVVAHVGDSRAMVCRRDGNKLVHVALTRDHHPELPEERSRIVAAGGIIHDGLIQYHFPMSRAIGDLPMTEFGVIGTPDVSRVAWDDQDEFLVVATDGIFEGLTGDEVCSAIQENSADSPQSLADKILSMAYQRSRDNLSLHVVSLQKL